MTACWGGVPLLIGQMMLIGQMFHEDRATVTTIENGSRFWVQVDLADYNAPNSVRTVASGMNSRRGWEGSAVKP